MTPANDKRARQIRAYQLRAEEIRTVSETTKDKRCKEALIRMANEYERLARLLEQLDTPSTNLDDRNITAT